MRRPDQRREDAVQGAEDEYRKKHDTDAEREGAQEREEVEGLGACHRLPDAVGDVEQGSDAGYGRGDLGHRIAQQHHVVVENPEYPMQILREGKRVYHRHQ